MNPTFTTDEAKFIITVHAPTDLKLEVLGRGDQRRIRLIRATDPSPGSYSLDEAIKFGWIAPVPVEEKVDDQMAAPWMEGFTEVTRHLEGGEVHRYGFTAGAPGVGAIATERIRQIEEEGFTEAHDDAHLDGQLVMAAMAYLQVVLGHHVQAESVWPWDVASFHYQGAKGRCSDLAKAGALIAAEVDRLARQEAQEAAQEGRTLDEMLPASREFAKTVIGAVEAIHDALARTRTGHVLDLEPIQRALYDLRAAAKLTER